MNIVCKANLFTKKVEDSARRGAKQGLTRAAAYVWGIAKRTIPYRKHKASRPGRPPNDHKTFKRSMKFAVDSVDLSAYIGPERLTQKAANPGGPAPETLEFGGKLAPVSNPAWFRKKAPPMKSLSEVAGYFQQIGYGPLFMGNSPADVIAQAQRGGKQAANWHDRIRKRKNVLTGKNVFFVSLPIKSRRQAMKAAGNAVREFGFPTTVDSRVAPRPFMGPTLEKAKNQLAKFWANTL